MVLNQLYFELLGTTLKGTDPNRFFETLDGTTQINVANVPTVFGSAVSGFINCTKGAGGDEGTSAIAFLKGLNPDQYGTVTIGTTTIRVLKCSVDWPENHPYKPTSVPGLNPWRYVSSNPTNNPGTYDLWVDILIRGKTNRISNWNKQPQLVATP